MDAKVIHQETMGLIIIGKATRAIADNGASTTAAILNSLVRLRLKTSMSKS